MIVVYEFLMPAPGGGEPSPTGRSMVFDSFDGALYTAKLKDGRAVMGPSGRVVWPHGPGTQLAWVWPTDRPAPARRR